jgi:hypothetical protein
LTDGDRNATYCVALPASQYFCVTQSALHTLLSPIRAADGLKRRSIPAQIRINGDISRQTQGVPVKGPRDAATPSFFLEELADLSLSLVFCSELLQARELVTRLD